MRNFALTDEEEKLMIINNVRLVAVVLVWSSIRVSVPSTIFAQVVPALREPATAQPSRAQTPTLTGVWMLNEALSDDSAKVMAAMQGARRVPTGHGPWMHGGGRGGRNQSEMRLMQERMHRAMEAPASLTITQASGSIAFADGRGRSQTLTTNNKKQKLALDDRMIEVRTRWYDGRLVNETSLGDDLKLMETYSLASVGRQLHVTVKLEGSHMSQPVHVRRVYDAAPPR